MACNQMSILQRHVHPTPRHFKQVSAAHTMALEAMNSSCRLIGNRKWEGFLSVDPGTASACKNAQADCKADKQEAAHPSQWHRSKHSFAQCHVAVQQPWKTAMLRPQASTASKKILGWKAKPSALETRKPRIHGYMRCRWYLLPQRIAAVLSACLEACSP